MKQGNDFLRRRCAELKKTEEGRVWLFDITSAWQG